MINLIPFKAKRNLLTEYWARVASVWMLLGAVALLFSAAMILPVYVLINAQVSSYASGAHEAVQKVAEYKAVSKELEQASTQSRIIVDQEQEPVFSDFITVFDNMRGSEIEITSISLVRSDGDLGPVNLKGTAETRQSLASFRDRLLSDKQIVEVELPISNLAKDSDIVFSLNVVLDTKIN